MPVCFLNTFLKAFISLSPISKIISFIVFLLNSCFFIASTFTLCIYSITELSADFFTLLQFQYPVYSKFVYQAPYFSGIKIMQGVFYFSSGR